MQVLRRHGVPSANFVGHSFGTFVIAHMRKLFPETVASVLLCDPVCMLTCFPQLLYNFIYKGVTLDGMRRNPADAARWFAARDLIIAETFCRYACPPRARQPGTRMHVASARPRRR